MYFSLAEVSPFSVIRPRNDANNPAVVLVWLTKRGRLYIILNTYMYTSMSIHINVLPLSQHINMKMSQSSNLITYKPRERTNKGFLL